MEAAVPFDGLRLRLEAILEVVLDAAVMRDGLLRLHLEAVVLRAALLLEAPPRSRCRAPRSRRLGNRPLPFPNGSMATARPILASMFPTLSR